MNKLPYYFSIAVILSAFILIFYVGYLLLYPFNPLIITKQPSTVLSKTVTAGQDLIYQVDYCRTGNGSAKVTRTISGETTIPTAIVETVTKIGCDKAVIHLPVPLGATPGIYHLEVTAEFRPNPLRTIIVSFRTEDFSIISGDAPEIINIINQNTASKPNQP